MELPSEAYFIVPRSWGIHANSIRSWQVIVVSRLGTWASHFWEAPGFTGGAAQFQTDVIGYLQSNLGGHAATFGGKSLRADTKHSSLLRQH